MADILFKRGKKKQLPAAKDGQILFASDTGELFIDEGTKHIQINANKAASADKINTNAGDSNKPVYFNNGIPVAISYEINKTVPSDAKFTDTTYSVASTTEDGLMSSADKAKLDGIANNANNYTHPAYSEKASGLYKITVDALGHVSATDNVAKGDITALGIPGQDTNTWREIKINGTSALGTGISTGSVNFKSGSNVTVSASNGTITIAAQDTKNTTGVSELPDTKLYLVASSNQSTIPSVTNTNAKIFIDEDGNLNDARGKVASGTDLQNVLTTSNLNGTANYLPKFTSANVLGNSRISDNGTTITLAGTTSVTGVTSITNTTASTNKSNGALKVSGGIGVSGRVSAASLGIDDKATVEYVSAKKALRFVIT